MSPERRSSKKRHPVRRTVATVAALSVLYGAYRVVDGVVDNVAPKTYTSDRIYDALTNVELGGETVFVSGKGEGSAQTTEQVKLAGMGVPFGDNRKTTVEASVDLVGSMSVKKDSAVSLTVVKDQISPSGFRLEVIADPDKLDLQIRDPHVKNNPDGTDGARLGTRIVNVFRGDDEIAKQYEKTGQKAKDNLEQNAGPVLGEVLPYGLAQAVIDDITTAQTLVYASGDKDSADALKKLADSPVRVTVLRPDEAGVGQLLYPETAEGDGTRGIVLTAEALKAMNGIKSNPKVTIVYSEDTTANAA